MGTYNHLLQLGDTVYLEIVALDPEADAPDRPRWFGLDDQNKVRCDWDEGRRLRGWVARTDTMDAIIAGRGDIFGGKVPFPTVNASFDFAIPNDGSLPLDGAAPSLIDRRGKPRAMATIVDLGARLRSFTLAHPDPAAVEALYRELTRCAMKKHRTLLNERYLRLMRPINNRDTRMPASKPTKQRRKADRTDPDA